MPGKRSRQGCEECRRRRRKCDEQKPSCGQCSITNRKCNYTLKLIWGGRKFKKSCLGQPSDLIQASAEVLVAEADDDGKDDDSHITITTSRMSLCPLDNAPEYLPNGIALPRSYRKLLNYFTEGILASLSCHPSIHQDLCRGLIPATLHSPQLLSACLALSAAGFVSRGLSEVEGVDISLILGHLQSSGLSLLRTALGNGETNEILLVTCLIWCLADVFACKHGGSSWRIHLQGFKSILSGNEAYQHFMANSGAQQSAMRHLYLLYLSLQTLPYVPSLAVVEQPVPRSTASVRVFDMISGSSSKIDGFLGYNEELLHVLHQINLLSSLHDDDNDENTVSPSPEADLLLGKVMGMVSRDAKAPPDVSICSSLSPEYGREFSLCHKCFQQATLIHLYRQLYRMPSGSKPVQDAVQTINEMVNNMTQNQPCHTWVAMAMPLFTVGCEAFTPEQKSFVLDKIDKLEECIGSLHVGIIRQALEDMWRVRIELGDLDGRICASQLLKRLQYSIILF